MPKPMPPPDSTPSPAPSPGRRRERRLPPEGHPWRYVTVEAPRCPACQSSRLRYDHTSRDQSEGTVSRHATCLDCQARTIVVFE